MEQLRDSERGGNALVSETPQAERTPTMDRPTPQIAWNYDEAEIRADGLIHLAGVSLAFVGAWVVIGVALSRTGTTTALGAGVYAISLIATLTLSALYNMWPVGPRKWLLRRFDHAGIYLLIAGTYTPFMLRMGALGRDFLIGVWCTALLGVALKLLFVGRFHRLATLSYLLLGWSGLALSGAIARTLPSWSLGLILLGGLVYSVGVVFHLSERLRFQNAIWHGCVLAGAATHYVAVMISLLALARA